jgi:hypothetical protein
MGHWLPPWRNLQEEGCLPLRGLFPEERGKREALVVTRESEAGSLLGHEAKGGPL